MKNKEYILGYLNGYQDGQKGNRRPDFPHRSEYNAGYNCGYEDGVYNEDPDYDRDDLDAFRKIENEILSFFAV